MSKEKIVFVADPGHGWALVPFANLKEFGIELQISEYSYRNHATVALEEDCDLTVYCDALRMRDIEFEFVEQHSDNDSYVRNWRRYYV